MPFMDKSQGAQGSERTAMAFSEAEKAEVEGHRHQTTEEPIHGKLTPAKSEGDEREEPEVEGHRFSAPSEDDERDRASRAM